MGGGVSYPVSGRKVACTWTGSFSFAWERFAAAKTVSTSESEGEERRTKGPWTGRPMNNPYGT